VEGESVLRNARTGFCSLSKDLVLVVPVVDVDFAPDMFFGCPFTNILKMKMTVLLASKVTAST